MMKIAWEIQKKQEILENLSEHGLLFSHDMAIHRPKGRSENGRLSRRIVLILSLGFADVFGRRSYSKRPKTPLWNRGSCSKGPMERVPTSETLGMYAWIVIAKQLFGEYGSGVHCVHVYGLPANIQHVTHKQKRSAVLDHPNIAFHKFHLIHLGLPVCVFGGCLLVAETPLRTDRSKCVSVRQTTFMVYVISSSWK